MAEPTFAMPDTWEDGQRRTGGPFLWAYVVPSTGTAPADQPPRKRGPRQQPKTIQLPGSYVLDSRGRRVVDLAPKTNGLSVSRATVSPFRAQQDGEVA